MRPSKKERKPSSAVLCVDCMKEARRVGLGVREERLRAAPLGETMSDSAGDVFGSMNQLEPLAKGRHEQSPDKQDCWFLAGPNVTSTLMLSTAKTIWDRLFFPLNELGARGTDARGEQWRRCPNQCIIGRSRQGSSCGRHVTSGWSFHGKKVDDWWEESLRLPSCAWKPLLETGQSAGAECEC